MYVHYPVNRSYLDTLYRTNNETLDKIVELTARVSADSAAEVRFIEIIGLASPEGPIAFNIRLAQRRAEALARYIQGRTGYPDSLFRLVSATMWPTPILPMSSATASCRSSTPYPTP